MNRRTFFSGLCGLLAVVPGLRCLRRRDVGAETVRRLREFTEQLESTGTFNDKCDRLLCESLVEEPGVLSMPDFPSGRWQSRPGGLQAWDGRDDLVFRVEGDMLVRVV